ncbi:MAG TPA: pirin family protein [Burkholderiales bacterium]
MTSIAHVVEGRRRDLGGFEVQRILPWAGGHMVGPFIFLDQMGPAVFAPGAGIDVRPHPHIGLATVTYLYEGEILHRDSLGVVQPIRPGEVNWMTAGRGIAHSERTAPELRSSGHRLWGLQSWVALPLDHEEDEPSFLHFGKEQLPLLERDGIELRLIAGTLSGMTSPVPALSKMFYADALMPIRSSFTVAPEHEERAVYIVQGALEVEDEVYNAGTLLVLAPGEAVDLAAFGNSRVVLLGGETVGERHIWWNFVASSQARIESAKRDWKAGHFAQVPGETEFIPLPEH